MGEEESGVNIPCLFFGHNCHIEVFRDVQFSKAERLEYFGACKRCGEHLYRSFERKGEAFRRTDMEGEL